MAPAPTLRRRWPARLLAPLLACVLPAAGAERTPGVVYRCTSPQGAVALQDAPCPAGHRSERREIAAFAPPAAPAAAPAQGGTDTAGPAGAAGLPASAAPSRTAAPAAAADSESSPPRIEFGPAEPAAPRPLSMPPPLWRCTDLNGKDRLVDAYDPQPRCVPLSVLGVDLSRAPPAAATLCRWVEDPCVELSGEAACAAWKERLDAAESALRQAFSDTAAERRRERDRARAVLESDCGG